MNQFPWFGAVARVGFALFLGLALWGTSAEESAAKDRPPARVGRGVASALAGSAGSRAGNDRLPKRLQAGYRVAKGEVQRYLRYILRKVWTAPLADLRGEQITFSAMRNRAEALVDDVVHLTLAQGQRILRDAVFGTGTTHLRFTHPELRAQARLAAHASLAPSATPTQTVADAIDRMGSISERMLNDRLERALLEDMEDYVQQRVEGGLGLPVQGRGRGFVRRLPSKYESVYQKEARLEVHRYLYWWLRKRQRLALGHLAMFKTPQEINRARDKGPVWKLTSGVSQEAWAQNRLRIDFKWGELNWEIDKRRLRRRMDQDLAQGTWAMARLVHELSAPETQAEANRELRRQVEQALDRPPQRKDAERYPDTARQLAKDLAPLKDRLDPIFNKAMDRVKLPGDMPPPLQQLARQHARTYMKEEMETNFGRAIRRSAVARAAGARVREYLGDWVGDALRRYEPVPGARPEAAKDFARKETMPRVRDAVGDALRAAGIDELTAGKKGRARAFERVMKHNRFDRAVDEAVDRALHAPQP